MNSGKPRRPRQPLPANETLQIPGYLGIPLSISSRPDLTRSQLAILKALADATSSRGVVSMSREELAEKSGASISVIKVAIANFIAAGIITETKPTRRGHRRFVIPWVQKSQEPPEPSAAEMGGVQNSAAQPVTSLFTSFTGNLSEQKTGTRTQVSEGGRFQAGGGPISGPLASGQNWQNLPKRHINKDEFIKLLQVIADRKVGYDAREYAIDVAAAMLANFYPPEDDSDWTRLFTGLLWKIYKENLPPMMFWEKILSVGKMCEEGRLSNPGGLYVEEIKSEIEAIKHERKQTIIDNGGQTK